MAVSMAKVVAKVVEGALEDAPKDGMEGADIMAFRKVGFLTGFRAESSLLQHRMPQYKTSFGKPVARNHT